MRPSVCQTSECLYEMHPKLRFSNKCSAFMCLYGAHHHWVRKQLSVLTLPPQCGPVTAAPREDVPRPQRNSCSGAPQASKPADCLHWVVFQWGRAASRVCCVPQGQGSPWRGDLTRGEEWDCRRGSHGKRPAAQKCCWNARKTLPCPFPRSSVCLVVGAENQAQTSDA